MNRNTYRPTRCKQAALVFCSLILSISGCGCSGAQAHYASQFARDDVVCKNQICLATENSATFGGRMHTLVEEI